MGMLTSRPGHIEDFAEVVAILGSSPAFSDVRFLAQWTALFAAPALSRILVTTLDGPEVVAFVGGAYVTDQFVDDVVYADYAPWISKHDQILSADEFKERNKDRSLQLWAAIWASKRPDDLDVANHRRQVYERCLRGVGLRSLSFFTFDERQAEKAAEWKASTLRAAQFQTYGVLRVLSIDFPSLSSKAPDLLTSVKTSWKDNVPLELKPQHRELARLAYEFKLEDSAIPTYLPSLNAGSVVTYWGQARSAITRIAGTAHFRGLTGREAVLTYVEQHPEVLRPR